MPITPTPDHSGSGLKTVSDSGTAPKSRLDDYQAAMTLVETLRKDAEHRNEIAARIKGMFDGNPPFSNTKLRNAGMAYYPNFNTLEGKAFLSSALVPYYDLFAGAPYHAEISLDIGDPNIEAQASRIVTEEFDRTLKDSTAFETSMWKMLHDFVAFGKGFHVWPDPVTCKSRHVAWHRVLFPEGTDVDMDDWEYFAVVWHYPAHDLYRRVRNKDKATAAGWNVDNTLRAIQMAARYDPANVNDWIGVQRQLRDHDLAADAQCDRVQTVWLFVKEFDGRWSWFILPLTMLMDPQNRKVPAGQQGFLYRRIGVYERASQIISPFLFEVMDGSINGLSGLGKDIFAPMQLKDRMACAKVNNVFLRSSVLMQARTGSARQKASLNQIGAVCVIPEGFEVQQSTVLGDIESTIVVGRDIDMMLQANTGIYRPQFEKPQGNPETATAAALRFQQGTVLGNSAVNRFHRQLDGYYEETYRRIVMSSDEAARKFRQWCKDRGVPPELLKKTRSVKSYRNVGNGNAFIRQTAFGNLMTLFPEFPEDGKQRFLEDAVAAFTNQQKVQRYIQTEQRENLPTRHVWEAMQENAALKEGAPVTWVPDQEDNTHLSVHARAVGEALQGAQAGADVAAVAVFGQAVLAHAAQHFTALERKGRKQQVKQWQEVYQQIAAAVNKLAGQAQRMAREQQQLQAQQAQMLSDQQLKAAEVSGKMQLQGMKTSHQMTLREKQAQQKMAIADATTAAEIARANAMAMADQARKNLTQRGEAGTNGD